MQGVDVLISFDCTGSMYPCLTQVRRVSASLVRRIFSEVSDLRVGVISHGDYCDEITSYVLKSSPFSSDYFTVCDFINDVVPTNGGDAPECYEKVLNEARKFLWRSDAKKIMILIGDDVPHGPNYPENKDHLDWRNEISLLLTMGVQIYGVHALAECREHSKSFYQEIAKKTGGIYLTLDQFSTVSDLILACCYKQVSEEKLESLVTEFVQDSKWTRNRQEIIYSLMGKKTAFTPIRSKGVSLAGRFQVLDVDTNIQIRDFIRHQGIEFQKGRGFYQLTKAETIQGQKEVVLVEKSTFDIFSGGDARELLGLPPRTGKDSEDRQDIRLQYHANKKTDLFQKYLVFIQSTSVNRVLVAGTKLLYEVSDWEVKS